jgi:hypothetical protein
MHYEKVKEKNGNKITTAEQPKNVTAEMPYPTKGNC